MTNEETATPAGVDLAKVRDLLQSIKDIRKAPMTDMQDSAEDQLSDTRHMVDLCSRWAQEALALLTAPAATPAPAVTASKQGALSEADRKAAVSVGSIGSSFEGFLKDEGVYDEIASIALKRAYAAEIIDVLKKCRAFIEGEAGNCPHVRMIDSTLATLKSAPKDEIRLRLTCAARCFLARKRYKDVESAQKGLIDFVMTYFGITPDVYGHALGTSPLQPASEYDRGLEDAARIVDDLQEACEPNESDARWRLRSAWNDFLQTAATEIRAKKGGA